MRSGRQPRASSSLKIERGRKKEKLEISTGQEKTREGALPSFIPYLM
jgi:hypothetical protein